MRSSCRVAAFVFLVAAPLMGGCTAAGLPYTIDLFNYGSHGVVIIDFPVTKNFTKKTPSEIRVEPSWAKQGNIRTFAGHLHSLPETVEVKWQLADLDDCDAKRQFRLDYVPDYLKDFEFQYPRTTKRNCGTWHVLDEVYTKQIDMAAIRNSEAYKAAGKSSGVGLHPYYLLISLVFRDNELRVVTSKAHGSGMHTSDDPNYW